MHSVNTASLFHLWIYFDFSYDCVSPLLLLMNWILVGKIILWATSIFFLLAQDITTVFWHLMFLWRSLRSALSCLFYKFLPPYSLCLKLSSFTRIWKTCQFLLVLHYVFFVYMVSPVHSPDWDLPFFQESLYYTQWASSLFFIVFFRTSSFTYVGSILHIGHFIVKCYLSSVLFVHFALWYFWGQCSL